MGEPLNVGIVGYGVISAQYLTTIDELITDPQVEVVLNLATPAAHAEVARRAIAAGKDVYGETPLAALPDTHSRV